MSAFVFVLSDGERHYVNAADGELQPAIARYDAIFGKPAILLWAEAVPDKATADRLVPLIEALDDDRYADLLAGKDEALSLLRLGD